MRLNLNRPKENFLNLIQIELPSKRANHQLPIAHADITCVMCAHLKKKSKAVTVVVKS